jgi:hypothetical protein
MHHVREATSSETVGTRRTYACIHRLVTTHVFISLKHEKPEPEGDILRARQIRWFVPRPASQRHPIDPSHAHDAVRTPQLDHHSHPGHHTRREEYITVHRRRRSTIHLGISLIKISISQNTRGTDHACNKLYMMRKYFFYIYYISHPVLMLYYI